MEAAPFERIHSSLSQRNVKTRWHSFKAAVLKLATFYHSLTLVAAAYSFELIQLERGYHVQTPPTHTHTHTHFRYQARWRFYRGAIVEGWLLFMMDLRAYLASTAEYKKLFLRRI